MPESTRNAADLRAGIGLRATHHHAMILRSPRVGWLEAHSENYFGYGPARSVLMKLRESYPVSLHGVGLSLGSTDDLSPHHLAELVRLTRDVQPLFVSEHLSWASVGGRFANDLLPLPYTEEALHHLIARVRQVQDALGRQMLIENVSSYLQFAESTLEEWEFLATLVTEADCGLLLDVNNVYVNATNHDFDPVEYLNALPRDRVQEIHLAGHSTRSVGDREVLIDTHDAPVCDAVWSLYSAAIDRFGNVPTLIEWDSNIPELDVLVAEAKKADALREVCRARAA